MLVARYPGVLAEVARELADVRPATVVNIWARRAASKRIEAAIIAGYNRRIEAELNPPPEGPEPDSPNSPDSDAILSAQGGAGERGKPAGRARLAAVPRQLSLLSRAIPLNKAVRRGPARWNDSVRFRRREFGLSEEDLAALAGVTKTTIWNMENGYAVSRGTAVKVERAFRAYAERLVQVGLKQLGVKEA